MAKISAKALILQELQFRLKQLKSVEFQLENLPARNTRNCRQLDTEIKRLQGQIQGLKYALGCLVQEAEGRLNRLTKEELEAHIEVLLSRRPQKVASPLNKLNVALNKLNVALNKLVSR